MNSFIFSDVEQVNGFKGLIVRFIGFLKSREHHERP